MKEIEVKRRGKVETPCVFKPSQAMPSQVKSSQVK
jgi:hypothetical protein